MIRIRMLLVLLCALAISACTSTAVVPTPPPNAGIKIDSPADNATMPAGDVVVKVEAVAVTFGDQYHWHLYVDDKMISMVTGGADTAKTNLTAGTHVIRVTLADPIHEELGSAQVKVTVTGAGSMPGATPTP